MIRPFPEFLTGTVDEQTTAEVSLGTEIGDVLGSPQQDVNEYDAPPIKLPPVNV